MSNKAQYSLKNDLFFEYCKKIVLYISQSILGLSNGGQPADN